MNYEMRVWVYARITSGRQKELTALCANTYREAQLRGYRVVGSSMEMKDGKDFCRPALYFALQAIHIGQADAIVVTDLGRLSHNIRTRYRILCDLQDHHTVLIALNESVHQKLVQDGTEVLFYERAKRKHLGVPWISEPVMYY